MVGVFVMYAGFRRVLRRHGDCRTSGVFMEIKGFAGSGSLGVLGDFPDGFCGLLP